MFHLSIAQFNAAPLQLCNLKSAALTMEQLSFLSDGIGLKPSNLVESSLELFPSSNFSDEVKSNDTKQGSAANEPKNQSNQIEVANSTGFSWELTSSINEANLTSLTLRNSGQPIRLSDGRRLHSGGQLEIENPVQVFQGRTLIDILPARVPDAIASGIRTIPNRFDVINEPQLKVDEVGLSPSGITLAHWFDCLGRLQRIGSGSAELFQESAASLVEPGGLDGGLLLLNRAGRWEVVGWCLPQTDLGFAFDPQLLIAMVEQRRTLFHSSDSAPEEIIDKHYNMQVCSPLLNSKNEIVGALVGIRAFHRMNQRRGIRPLEAQFVQLVADCISAGMIRMKQESELIRKQLLLEQAFPAEVVKQFHTNPQILDANEREISVLFCDMRGFSKACEGIEGQIIYRMLAHVMDYLTDHLRQQNGTVIDYYGDGVAAFWNAPIDQVNHPDLACRAALSILGDLDELNSEWQELLGFPLKLGVGIHCGEALVGNSGSRYRIKYGPRGQTVNVACRLEAATKHVGVPLLVSGEVAQRLSDSFHTLRVGRMRLPGMKQPLQVCFPIEAAENARFLDRNHLYEEALKLFEADQYQACCDLLEAKRTELSDLLIEYLFEQSLARKEGRFDRRQGDEVVNFVPLPTPAETQA